MQELAPERDPASMQQLPGRALAKKIIHLIKLGRHWLAVLLDRPQAGQCIQWPVGRSRRPDPNVRASAAALCAAQARPVALGE